MINKINSIALIVSIIVVIIDNMSYLQKNK